VHVERDLAGSHQLRERPTRTAGVGDPDRLGEPQPSNAAGLAEEREAVRGERHQPVDGADQLDVAQRGQQPAGLLTSRGEVGGCERALRWMPARTGLLDLLGLDQHRLVVVGTDPVGGVVLAEVHGAILMSEDRVDHLALLAGELGERGAARVLVDHRDERKADAGEGGDAGAPEAGADDDVLGANRALRRLDRPHASPLDADIGHVATAEGQDSGLGRTAGERLGGPYALADAVGGDEEAADDPVRIEQRYALANRRRIEQLGVEPVGERPAVAAVELLPPLLGGRDLDSPDLVITRPAIELEPSVEVNRPLRELGHRPRGVQLEHQPGGVRGRPAGLPERALLDHDHVLPSSLREVIRDARAGDPASDDHRACRARERLGPNRGVLAHDSDISSRTMDGQPAPTAPPGPPSPGSSNRPSIADRAYFGLRDQIVTLRLPPGTALIEDALMRELEIGRTPLREAVKRLALESLVEIRPRRGTYVTDVNVADIVHITEVRAELEGTG
jgi:hypothetical protein